MEQNAHSNLGKLGMNNRIWKSNSGSCSQFREGKKEWLDIATVISSLWNKKKVQKEKKEEKTAFLKSFWCKLKLIKNFSLKKH